MAFSMMQSAAVAAFKCLGDACEDTCCKGWGMQVSSETVAKYRAEAPELLDAVTSGEAEHIMRRDPETDYCVKFDAGWCGVHAKYGEGFLGDACHFYPRVTRQIGDQHLMTAALSCPEIVRLGVVQGLGFDVAQGDDAARVPFSLKQYCPPQLEPEKALEVHRFFLQALTDETIAPQRAMARVRSVAASLEAVDVQSWAVAAPFYWNQADTRLPIAEGQLADPFNLLNALQGLIGASKQTKRPRLDATIADMERALAVSLNWQTLGIATSDASLPAWQAMQAQWQLHWGAALAPVLRRWLQGQLSVMCFPFAGLGNTLTERAILLGVRFATLQLALMSACFVRGALVGDDDVVRIMQSLARFLDHLADPTLSLQIYTETGWVREARLRALVLDA